MILVYHQRESVAMSTRAHGLFKLQHFQLMVTEKISIDDLAKPDNNSTVKLAVQNHNHNQ